jgi:delta1-piperideine-2-carboxylate reductase
LKEFVVHTVALSLQEIEDLARRCFSRNGCDAENTEALVRTVVTAERDGSLSHGLFRVPALVKAARELGVAVLATTRVYHFAALWPEVEAIASHGLVGMACVCYTPFMA